MGAEDCNGISLKNATKQSILSSFKIKNKAELEELAEKMSVSDKAYATEFVKYLKKTR